MQQKNILDISETTENFKEKIKLVTFGGSYSHIDKPEEIVPSNQMRGPRVDGIIYTDANGIQYVLGKSPDQDLYYGDVAVQYIDAREEPHMYENLSLLSNEEKSLIIKRIVAINYAKTKELKELDLDSYCYICISVDWYILINYEGEVESTVLSHDERAKREAYSFLNKSLETIKKNHSDIDINNVKEKIISLAEKGGVQ